MMRDSTYQTGSVGHEPAARLCGPPAGGWQLAVQFFWHDDRFAHRLELVPLAPHEKTRQRSASSQNGDALSPADPWRLAGSIEGDPHTEWPISPPFQQLDRCQLAADRSGLVAVGMAGTSHWSLAVEADSELLWFDVACRVQRPLAELRSTYLLAYPFAVRDSSETGCVLEFETTPEADVDAPRLPRLQVQIDPKWTTVSADPSNRTLCFCPVQAWERLPATVRWRYGVACQTA
jgi:hypothetical protein